MEPRSTGAGRKNTSNCFSMPEGPEGPFRGKEFLNPGLFFRWTTGFLVGKCGNFPPSFCFSRSIRLPSVDADIAFDDGRSTCRAVPQMSSIHSLDITGCCRGSSPSWWYLIDGPIFSGLTGSTCFRVIRLRVFRGYRGSSLIDTYRLFTIPIKPIKESTNKTAIFSWFKFNFFHQTLRVSQRSLRFFAAVCNLFANHNHHQFITMNHPRKSIYILFVNTSPYQTTVRCIKTLGEICMVQNAAKSQLFCHG